MNPNIVLHNTISQREQPRVSSQSLLVVIPHPDPNTTSTRRRSFSLRCTLLISAPVSSMLSR